MIDPHNPGASKHESTHVVTVEDLLKDCTVSIQAGNAHGTGFFIAPQLIATCHNVIGASDTATIRWRGNPYTATVANVTAAKNWGLALLRVDGLHHPCAYLSEDIRPGDKIYAFCYPDDRSSGESVVFDFNGQSSTPPLLKLKGGPVKPGTGGAPALNLRTGGVCGIITAEFKVKARRDARAIPLRTLSFVCQKMKLEEQQFSYHRTNSEWISLLVSQDFERWVRPRNLAELARHLHFTDQIMLSYGMDEAQSGRDSDISTMALVIGRLLQDFPVDRLTHEGLMESSSVSDLYRAVDELIDRFQRLCDQIVEILAEAKIDEKLYGSAERISGARLTQANRKLSKIATDMHHIAAPLGHLLRDDSVLKQRLDVVAALTAEIAVVEDFLVVKLNDATSIDDGGAERFVYRGSNYIILTESDHHPVATYQRILSELDSYRAKLRIATAEAIAISVPLQTNGQSKDFFLWRTPWKRAGVILVGLATVVAAVAAILALLPR